MVYQLDAHGYREAFPDRHAFEFGRIGEKRWTMACRTARSASAIAQGSGKGCQIFDCRH
jgi:hypothetical protein